MIYFVRGQFVMLDFDLAPKLGVTTTALNRIVKRNPARFPSDFCFQLTAIEYENLQLKRENNPRISHLRYPPHVFTDYGAFMAATLFTTDRSIAISLSLLRTLVHGKRKK
jgi:hypothetical protein